MKPSTRTMGIGKLLCSS